MPKFLASFLAVMVWATVLPVSAAPLASADPVPSPQSAPAESMVGAGASGASRTGAFDSVHGTDVPNQSKTIEMLLEMQGKNPGLAAGERPRQDEPPMSRKTVDALSKAVLPFAAGDASQVFGGAALVGPKGRAPAPGEGIEWSQPTASRFGGGTYAGSSTGNAGSRESYPGAAASSEDDDVRWLIPRPLVRFVRQNRELVVGGSVLVLLLIWAAAAISTGRRK